MAGDVDELAIQQAEPATTADAVEAEPVETVQSEPAYTAEDVQNALELGADVVTCLLVCIALLACILGALIGSAVVRWWRV